MSFLWVGGLDFFVFLRGNYFFVMRFIFAFLLCFVAFGLSAEVAVRVVDDCDGDAVPGATVIGRSGLILGLSDAEGMISFDEARELPLTVRCVGYEPLTVPEVCEEVRLVPARYQLGELVVNAQERPVTRVLCFAREYCSGITGADTMQMYSEYMAVAYIADKKVKGYKKVDAKPWARSAKRYARIARESGVDSVFSPRRGDDITGLSWFENIAFLPTERSTMPESMLAGADADSVAGKYSASYQYRKRNGLFTVTRDMLCDHKDHVWTPFFFKLIGMTIDVKDGYWSQSFAVDDSGSYGLEDFVMGTYSIHMIGRGRLLRGLLGTKHPLEMDCYVELYPLSREHYSVAEYKEMKEDYSRIDFIYPDGLQPLSPAVERLVDRIRSEQPDKK